MFRAEQPPAARGLGGRNDSVLSGPAGGRSIHGATIRGRKSVSNAPTGPFALENFTSKEMVGGQS